MKKKLPPSRMIEIQPFDYQDFDNRIDDLKSYCKIIGKQKIQDQNKNAVLPPSFLKFFGQIYAFARE